MPEQQKRNRGIVEGTPSAAGVRGGGQTHEAGPLPGRKTCERRGECFGTEAAARWGLGSSSSFIGWIGMVSNMVPEPFHSYTDPLVWA